jgi:hypothetical protein
MLVMFINVMIGLTTKAHRQPVETPLRASLKGTNEE